MKRSRWLLAWAISGGIAGLLAVSLIATPYVRDQLLQFASARHERSEGDELAQRLVSSESLLDYSVTHPDQVALACWELGDESNGLHFNASRSQPASHASTLLVLAAYASGADPAKQADMPLSLGQWERYWLPGTDGGAHVAALLEARATGALQDEDGSFASAGIGFVREPRVRGSVQLGTVVRAMVRHADPSASDVLLDHLGRTRLTERVLGLGFPVDAVPLPTSSVQRSLASDVAVPELLARFRALSREAYADATWASFAQLHGNSELAAGSVERQAGFSLRESAELTAALSPRGTAGLYAHLLEQIAAGELDGAEYMRAQLERPLPAADVHEELDQLGNVRGSEPGVYASLSYGRARGTNKTRVLAVMFRKLPMGVWLRLSSGYLLQRFETDLLSDDAFFEKAKARLNVVAEESDSIEAAADIRAGRAR